MYRTPLIPLRFGQDYSIHFKENDTFLISYVRPYTTTQACFYSQVVPFVFRHSFEKAPLVIARSAATEQTNLFEQPHRSQFYPLLFHGQSCLRAVSVLSDQLLQSTDSLNYLVIHVWSWIRGNRNRTFYGYAVHLQILEYLLENILAW